MARVKFLKALAGERFVHRAGDVVELDSKEAKRYIAAGICEATRDKPSSRAPVMSTTGETAAELAQKARAEKKAEPPAAVEDETETEAE